MYIKIEIPEYIREVEVSKAQREIYWELKGNKILAKNKPLLKRFLNRNYKKEPKFAKVTDLAPGYAILAVYKGIAYNNYNEYVSHNSGKRKILSLLDFSVNVKWLLADLLTQKLVIANETKAGKPKTIPISANNIISGQGGGFTRQKVFSEIGLSFIPYMQDIPKLTDLPIRIELEIFDTVKSNLDNSKDEKGRHWDVDGRAMVYMKIFPDLLVKGFTLNDKLLLKPCLEDDDRLTITGQNVIFTPIENTENRKLVFTIIKDDREVIKGNKFYNGKFKKPVKEVVKKRNKEMKQVKLKF